MAAAPLRARSLAHIEEELHELRQHVYTKEQRRDLDAMRAEAIQVGAMALRFVIDICDGGRGRE